MWLVGLLRIGLVDKIGYAIMLAYFRPTVCAVCILYAAWRVLYGVYAYYRAIWTFVSVMSQTVVFFCYTDRVLGVRCSQPSDK